MSASPPELDRQRKLITIATAQAWYRIPAVIGAAIVLVLVAVGLIVALLSPHVSVPREAFGVLTQRSWGVLGFAAAIGVASAATIQLAKQLFGVRSRFQWRWVRDWIGERCAIEPLWANWQKRYSLAVLPAAGAAPAASIVPGGVNAADLADAQRSFATAELESALLGGFADRELRRVFDLPIEQLCAQISAAADQAMAQPHLYAELLLALTGPAGLDDIDALAPPADVVGGRVIRAPSVDSSAAGDNPFAGADNRAYARVAQGVRAGIDLMQISVGQRWTRGIRASAVAVCGALGAAGVFFIRITWPTRLLFALAALVLGGFFAWLARDLAAIVERTRR